MLNTVSSAPSLPLAPVVPSWKLTATSLLRSLAGIRRYFATLGPRTTLVRDPYAAENTRD